jgi:site-specific recombinase XerD
MRPRRRAPYLSARAGADGRQPTRSPSSPSQASRAAAARQLKNAGASDVFTAIAENAGLDEPATAHVGRHTFINELIRGGEDLVLVAELSGHARLETLRLHSRPTEADKQNALRHLPVDR